MWGWDVMGGIHMYNVYMYICIYIYMYTFYGEDGNNPTNTMGGDFEILSERGSRCRRSLKPSWCLSS